MIRFLADFCPEAKMPDPVRLSLLLDDDVKISVDGEISISRGCISGCANHSSSGGYRPVADLSCACAIL